MAAQQTNIITVLLQAKDQATKKIRSAENTLLRYGGTGKKAQERVDALNKANANLANTQKQLDRALGKTQVQFQGWALSIMFAGMAVKRAMDQIWKSSSRTFNDVMHSVDGTVTGFDMLQGSLKFLSFTVGQALEPLAEALIPIIDRIQTLVANNPALTRFVVAFGAIFGTVALLGGQLVLAVAGFKELAGLIGAGGKLAAGSLAIAGPIAAIAAGLAIIGGISWKAFKETPEAWQAMKDAFKSIKEGGAIDAMKDALEALVQSILPSFQLNWENIAWLLAYAGAVGAQVFSIIINSIAISINSLGVLIGTISTVVSALRALRRRDLGGAADAVKNYENVWKRAADNIGDSIANIGQDYKDIGSLAALGPEGFKEQQLARQALFSATPQDPTSPVLTDTTSKGDMIINEMRVEFTGPINQIEDFKAALDSLTRG